MKTNENTFEINNVVFDLRWNESFILTNDYERETKATDLLLLVAFAKAPKLEISKRFLPYDWHEECTPTAIVAAAPYQTQTSNYKTKIGWVSLGPETKKAIGNELFNIGAFPGQWFLMVVDRDENN